MRGHRGKAGINHPYLAFLDLVDSRLHVVVDAALRNPTKRRERSGVRVEQHLVALRRIRLNDKGAAVTELEVRHEDLAPKAANEQTFFAPVELVRFPRRELQRHEGAHHRFATVRTPAPDEFGDAAVVAVESLRLDLGKQLERRSSLSDRTPGVYLQHLDQPICVRANLGTAFLTSILRLHTFRCIEPLANRLARDSRSPFNLRQRQSVPVVQPPDSSQHVHGDHLLCFPAHTRSGKG